MKNRLMFLKQSTDFKTVLWHVGKTSFFLFSPSLFIICPPFFSLNWLKPNRKSRITKISDLSVDVSLTLTVNVTSDCQSQWHAIVLKREEKKEPTETSQRGKSKEKQLSRSSTKYEAFPNAQTCLPTIQLHTLLIKHS